MRAILNIVGIFFLFLGLIVTWKDVSADGRGWHSIGEIWYGWAPGSLQMSESIISRYIDPCGLIHALGCTPFLWHPLISTTLTFYATPSFLLFGFGLVLLKRWLDRRPSAG